MASADYCCSGIPCCHLKHALPLLAETATRWSRLVVVHMPRRRMRGTKKATTVYDGGHHG